MESGFILRKNVRNLRRSCRSGCRDSERNTKVDDFELNAISCDGIDKCKAALLKASKGVLPNNFIEGMVCMRGCVGGMGNPTWREDISEEIEEHAEEAEITEILTHLEL